MKTKDARLLNVRPNLNRWFGQTCSTHYELNNQHALTYILEEIIASMRLRHKQNHDIIVILFMVQNAGNFLGLI